MRQQRGFTTTFMVMGAATAALPASIPFKAQELGLVAHDLLNSIPLLFLGLLIGIVITPNISTYFSASTQIRIALLIQGAGVLGVGLSQNARGFEISALVLGIGFGQLEVLVTSAIRRTSSDVGGSLTKLGAFLSLSAFLTPLLILVTQRFEMPNLAFVLITSFTIVNAITFRCSDARESKRSYGFLNSNKNNAILLLIASGLYVGAETILSGWSAVYFQDLFPTIGESAPLGTSLFWLFLTLGRFTSPYINNRYRSVRSSNRFWLFSFAIFLIPLIFMHDLNSQRFTFAFICLSFYFAGPCYGIIIGLAVSLYEKEFAVKTSSLFILFGSVGGVALPAIVQISSNGNLKGASIVCALAAFLASIFATISTSMNRPIAPL